MPWIRRRTRRPGGEHDELWFDRALYGFEREGFSAIRDAYKARCVNLGRHVTFDGGEGTALDVDEEGRLVVQGAEGSTHVFTGEVSVHGIYGAV